MHPHCFGPSPRTSSLAQPSAGLLGSSSVQRNVGCRVRDGSAEGPMPSLARQNTFRVAASSVSLAFEEADAWNDRAQQSTQASTSAEGTTIPQQGVERTKPLKINLDLALFKARSLRQQAYRQVNGQKKKVMLEETEATLLRCMAMDPTDGRSYVSLGRLYVQQRRYDEAEAVFDRGCTATRGANAFIWTSWANLETKRGNVTKARKMFDAATVADDTHAAAWHGWGLLEKRQGNFLRARDLWLKGVQKTRNKPNPYLYQSLAVLAVNLKRPDEARKWFKAGTSTPMGGASHAMWQAWALLEAEQGDPSLVRKLFRKGLEVSPRSRYIYLSWALWEQRLGNISNARKLLQRGHDLNRTDPAILQAWGMLEGQEGKVEEARVLFEKAVEIDASHLYVWQAWGVMEFRQGNLSKARELFQRGIWADPDSPSVALVFQAWAVLERAAGDYESARALFKCAVRADPKNSPSWMAWAAMEEDLGLYFNARELRNRNLQAQVEVVLPNQLLRDPDEVERSKTLQETITAWFNTFRQRSSTKTRRNALRTVESLDEEEEEGQGGEQWSRRRSAMGNADGIQLTAEFFPTANGANSAGTARGGAGGESVRDAHVADTMGWEGTPEQGARPDGVPVVRPQVPDDFDQEFDRVVPLANARGKRQ